MARTVLLHHPDLDRTVECRPAQARVLAQSGWQRIGSLPPEPEPVDDNPPDETPTDDDTEE